DAALALGQISSEESVISALTAALAGPTPVRRHAALALEHIGPDARSAVPDLARVCRDPDRDVAAAACRALGRMNTPAAATPLVTRMLANDAPARRAAVPLSRMGLLAKPAAPALIAALKSENETGHLARAVLERLGPVVVPDLEEALADADPVTRRRAAEVLGLM